MSHHSLSHSSPPRKRGRSNIRVSREHLLRMRELAAEFGCVSFTSLDPDIVCWEKETDVEGECEFDSN